jgi:hypothetical protein
MASDIDGKEIPGCWVSTYIKHNIVMREEHDKECKHFWFMRLGSSKTIKHHTYKNLPSRESQFSNDLIKKCDMACNLTSFIAWLASNPIFSLIFYQLHGTHLYV